MKLTTAFFVLSLTSGISSHVEAADGATIESNKATVAAAARKDKKKQSGLRLAADAIHPVVQQPLLQGINVMGWTLILPWT